jgi:ketosteroid isomerase-like protein
MPALPGNNQEEQIMIKRLLVSIVMVFAAAGSPTLAQNSNSSTTVRPRTTAPASTTKATDTQKSTDVQQPKTTKPTASKTQAKPKVATETSGPQSVTAAFNGLINGIRHADVNAVTSVYLNSPRLILFNSNGTVTRGWDQLRKNRESSYRDAKDVKLDVRDLSITMLGRDGALVSCLWTQSQTYKGAPETATGRMTLVFKRVGKDWKAIHLHTSPDRPDPSRVLPSEQTPNTTPTPAQD